MSEIIANNTRIAYQWHGNEEHPVMLLVQGLGMPLSAWPDAFIDSITAAGYRALIFDNRDIGESQLFDKGRTPNLVWQFIRSKMGLKVRSVYTLTDMANDAAALLAALDINSAHVVGVSMGGMISQLMAIHHPQTVISLTSIMSTTGNRKLPPPQPHVSKHILSTPKNPTDEERLAFNVKTWELIGSPAYQLGPEESEQRVRKMLSRGVTRDGVNRQLFAIMASPSRVDALASVKTPTLIIHGDQDPLVLLECGKDTAAAIKESRLEIIEGMGHDLPDPLVGRITGLIISHAATAANRRAAA